MDILFSTVQTSSKQG